MMSLSRRKILLSGVGASAGAMTGCTSITNPTTGDVTYGLDPTVVAFITNAVQKIMSYAPAIRRALRQLRQSLFGPAYGAIVTAGSAAVQRDHKRADKSSFPDVAYGGSSAQIERAVIGDKCFGALGRLHQARRLRSSRNDRFQIRVPPAAPYVAPRCAARSQWRRHSIHWALLTAECRPYTATVTAKGAGPQMYDNDVFRNLRPL